MAAINALTRSISTDFTGSVAWFTPLVIGGEVPYIPTAFVVECVTFVGLEILGLECRAHTKSIHKLKRGKTLLALVGPCALCAIMTTISAFCTIPILTIGAFLRRRTTIPAIEFGAIRACAGSG